MNASRSRTVFVSEHIEKKRKRACDQTTEIMHGVSAEMRQTIEGTFADRIKQLVKDAPYLTFPEDGIETLSILSAVNIPVKKIPCYSREYEESMMRPALTGEDQCLRGNSCECTQIAIQDPTIDNTCAFVGVALQESHQLCLLCVRRKVSQLFYHYLITKTSPEVGIQPHYNRIDNPDEYSKNCVFLPTSLAGITDPFVMHLRHNYSYSDGKIVQQMLNFNNASFLYNSQSFFLQKNIKNCADILQYTEAEYFAKIHNSQCFQERFQLEAQLYLALPTIYNSEYNKTTSTYMKWERLSFSILDASFFLPIIFGTKLHTDKITKNIPIIHIISKGLPQRSQFRNFLNISLECLDSSEDFQIFFKQLFTWSLIGIHYKWNNVCVPLCRRIQLFELGCIQNTDWKKLLTVNVRLFFFMIKEYLCYIIRENIGLYNTLLDLTEWINYETEIFRVMNEVRSIYATSSTNPLKQMLTLTQKLLPRPNIVSWPKTSAKNNVCLSVSGQIKLHEILVHQGYKPNLATQFDTLSEYKLVLQILKCKLSMSAAFNRIVEMNKCFAVDLRTLLATTPIDEKILQHFINITFIEKILNSVTTTELPIHQIDAQLSASIRKHDLNIHDPSFTKTLFQTTSYYFCIGCEDVRFLPDVCKQKRY